MIDGSAHVLNAQGQIKLNVEHNYPGLVIPPGDALEITDTLLFNVTGGDTTLTVPASGSVALGDGAANQIAVWSNANTLDGFAGLTYTAPTLTISAATDPEIFLNCIGVGGFQAIVASDTTLRVTWWADGDSPIDRIYLVGSSGYLGLATAPSARLHVLDSSNTAIFQAIAPFQNIQNIVILRRTHLDGAAPNAGFGAGLLFELQGEDDANVSAGQIVSAWEVNQTNNTTARDAALLFYTILDNVLAEKMRLTSAGALGIATTGPLGLFHVRQTVIDVAGYFENAYSGHDNIATLVLRRTRADSTPPNAGFGTSLFFQGEGFTNNSIANMGAIQSLWEVNQTNDTTDRDAAMVFYTMINNVIGEKMRLTSAGELRVFERLRLDNITSGASLRMRLIASLANGGVAQFLNNAIEIAWCFVINNQTGAGAAFVTRGGIALTHEVSDPTATFSAAAGAASSTNVYWSAANSRYELQNNTGVTVSYYVFYFTIS